jgi:hypothetical protein
MNGFLSELIKQYIEMCEETLEIISNPEWVEMIKEGKREVKEGVKGKTPDSLED